jgi:TPP-dependent pyruvate/acetoin dehydrogenase alpha subunit
MVDEMEERAKEMVNEAVEFAQNEPYPPVEFGMGGVYAQEVEHA